MRIESIFHLEGHSLIHLCLTGPLVLVAVIYEVLGVALAWIIGQFFWVPHRFRYGLLIAGGWGNVGDLGMFINFSYSRFD